MAQQFNLLPAYRVKLEQDENTTSAWYFFWSSLYYGLAPSAVVPLTVGASPFTYTMPAKGFLLIAGGTVSLVEFSRDGITFYSYGATVGQFHANSADRIRITYTVIPTVTMVPT